MSSESDCSDDIGSSFTSNVRSFGYTYSEGAGDPAWAAWPPTKSVSFLRNDSFVKIGGGR